MFRHRKRDWRHRLAEAWPEHLGGHARRRRVSLPRLERFDLPHIGLPRAGLHRLSLQDLETRLGRLRELAPPRRKSTDWKALLVAGLAGAALAYLFDPDRGKRRRTQGRDRLLGGFRRAGGRAGRAGRHAASDAQGLAHRAFHEPGGDPDPNDATLAQRVLSELFRDPDVPKGRINVNVERGVVVLRGDLDDPSRAEELERRALQVPGVQAVENLLHSRREWPRAADR